MKNPYQKLIEKKRTWSPVRPVKGKVREGSEEVLSRALALRHMELPVGDFITDALEKNVPDAARELLLSNVKDEERHDVALGYIADAHGVNEKDEAEALRIRDAWIAHPDHTIVKAMVAERSIFFCLLPLMRFNGDAGFRGASADVSRDEVIHVSTNSLICRELGLDISDSLDRLRLATIHWVMQPLSATNTDKYLNKRFWLESSNNLMYQGKAPQLTETKAGRMPAFFEHDARNLPQYA